MALEAYAATYLCPELDVPLTFGVAKSGLVAAQRKFLPRAVSPACEDTFADDKTALVFTRGHGGKVEGVTLSLERVHTAHVRPRAVSRAPVFLSKSLQLMIPRLFSSTWPPAHSSSPLAVRP